MFWQASVCLSTGRRGGGTLLTGSWSLVSGPRSFPGGGGRGYASLWPQVHSRRKGVSLSWFWLEGMGVPLSWPWPWGREVGDYSSQDPIPPARARIGVPLHPLGQGYPLPPGHDTLGTGYTAVGMPLAVTQEDFLVLFFFLPRFTGRNYVLDYGRLAWMRFVSESMKTGTRSSRLWVVSTFRFLKLCLVNDAKMYFNCLPKTPWTAM